MFWTGAPLCDSAQLSALAARKPLDRGLTCSSRAADFVCMRMMLDEEADLSPTWTGAPLCDSAQLSSPPARKALR